jgi:hypothetical protein
MTGEMGMNEREKGLPDVEMRVLSVRWDAVRWSF